MKIFACPVIVCVELANIFVICMSCGDGYFFDEQRKCVPCPKHCLFCDSSTKCLSCESGYWGTVCEVPCSKCQTGTNCEKTNGFCLEACRDGISGVLCDASCDSKCFSCKRANILNCVKCAFGRYPPFSCENFCSTCNNTTCDDNGNCIFGCVKGYWDKTCTKLCPEHCSDKLCDRKNGDCIDGCEGNYVGKKCDDKETSNIAIIIIVPTTTIIVTILGIIVAIIIWRKRKSNSSRSAESGNKEAARMLDFDTANATIKQREDTGTDVDKVQNESVAPPMTKPSKTKTHKSKSTMCVCCVKKRNNKSLIDETEMEAVPNTVPSKTKPSKPKPESKQGTMTDSKKQKESKSERQDKLYKYAKSLERKTDKDYQTDWEKITKICSSLSYECNDLPGTLEAHGIGPYEDNKVIVSGKTRTYYFNASYIKEKGIQKPTYIACIGPNTEYTKCFALFWRMVLQNNCTTIVMLNTIKKKQDEQYWPSTNQPQIYNQITVRLTDEQEGENYVIRRFNVKEQGPEVRHVTQIQYKTWPETERASNMGSFLEFFKTVQTETSKTGGPILVHGRAGVGRTGTFIALDILRKDAENMLDSVDKVDEKRIDIAACAELLRTQRVSMVETVEQYKFLHEAFTQVILNMLDERGYKKKDG